MSLGCSDVFKAVQAQCESLPASPNLILIHLLDALKLKLIKRLPRKLKKQLKKQCNENRL